MPGIHTPSRQSGYARSASEAEYPQLWPTVGWSPALQQQGGLVMKEVGSRYPGTTNAMEVDDWETILGKNAITCGGTNEYVTTTAPRLVNLFSGIKKATIVMHVYHTSSSSYAGFSGSGIRNRFGIQNDVSGSGVYFISDTPGIAVYGSFSGTFSGWHHFAIVFDGSLTGDAARLKGYINGTQRSLTFGANPIGTTTQTFTSFDLAKYKYGGSNTIVNGSYGDVVAYNRALNDKEIKLLYRLGPGGWAQRRRRCNGRVPAAPAAFTGKTFRAMRLAR
jgi:hypothetical protein